jgi:hypothetical protein
MRRMVTQIVVIIKTYQCYLLHTKFYPTSFCQGSLHIQTELLGIISMDFDIRDQLLIKWYAFGRYVRKNGNTEGQGQGTTSLWTS